MPPGLGLERTAVELVEPDHEWTKEYARERLNLSKAIGELALAIEHVGSTAVPALPAKPIIDIAVSVQSEAEIPKIVPKLEGIGYLYRGDAPFQGGHLFVRESSPGVRTHHVHVVQIRDPQWREWVRFRDFLKTNSELRKDYAQLKLELKNRFPSDRRAYTLGKTRFIKNTLKDEV